MNEKKEIEIKIDNGYKTTIKKINIKEGFKYTNEAYDITIIELKNINKDDTYEFLDFDENILNDNGVGYICNSIYILHYPSHFEENKAVYLMEFWKVDAKIKHIISDIYAQQKKKAPQVHQY